MNRASSSNRVRRLTDIEASMASMHAILGGNTQVSTLVLLAGNLSLSAATIGFERLFSAHPLLRFAIHEYDGELGFVLHDDFSRIPVVEAPFDPSVPDRMLLEREMAVPLDAGSALWRVTLLADPSHGATRIMFTRHHAISDSFTTHWLIREWLGHIASDIRRETVRAPRELSMAADTPPAWPRTEIGHGPVPFFSDVPLASRGTGVWHAALAPAAFARLQAFAARDGFTSNTLLANLLGDAFCEWAGVDEIPLFTAISTRERDIPPARIAETLGCRIVVAAPILTPRSAPFAERCERYQREIRAARRAAATETDAPGRPHREIAEMITALGRASSFCGIGLTNLGRLDEGSPELFDSVIDLQTVVNRVGGNLALALHASEFRGRLRLVFTYPRPLVPDALIAQTAATLVDKVEAL